MLRLDFIQAAFTLKTNFQSRDNLMKIFNDLQNNQAVKTESGEYVVALAAGQYYFGTDGPHRFPKETQVILSDCSIVYKVREVPGEIVGYTLEGSPVSIETYRDRSVILNGIVHECYDSDTEEMVFPDLDTELEYTRLTLLQSRHVAQYGPSTTVTDLVKINVIGSCINTGSKFIESPFRFGNVKFSNNGVFKILVSEIALDEYKKVVAEYPDVSFDNTNHSNIRYAKMVPDKYLFTDQVPGARENQVNIVSTLDEAKAREQEVRTIIRNRMQMAIVPTKVSENLITEFSLLSQLEDTYRMVSELDVKAKHDHKHRLVISKVRRLVDDLQRISKDSKKEKKHDRV